jgi:2-polyprenyl-3-methyl-5-hydroxy-6-metoxy-1,4-benzoquinol methylase
MSHADRVAQFFDDPDPYLRRSYNIRLRRETVREMVGERRPDSILDIGCGDGSLSLQLLTGQNRLMLVDVTQAMLEVAMSRVPENLRPTVKTFHGDFLKATFEPESFDLILCLGVLAHVDSPSAVVARICSLLKPGGLVIVTISSGRHPLGWLRARYVGMRDLFVRPLYKLKWLSPRQVLRQFQDGGLGLKQSFRYNFPAPFMDRLLSNDLLYNRIRRIHGRVGNNRRAWMGSEGIYALEKPAAQSGR